MYIADVLIALISLADKSSCQSPLFSHTDCLQACTPHLSQITWNGGGVGGWRAITTITAQGSSRSVVQLQDKGSRGQQLQGSSFTAGHV